MIHVRPLEVEAVVEALEGPAVRGCPLEARPLEVLELSGGWQLRRPSSSRGPVSRKQAPRW